VTPVLHDHDRLRCGPSGTGCFEWIGGLQNEVRKMKMQPKRRRVVHETVPPTPDLAGELLVTSMAAKEWQLRHENDHGRPDKA